MNESTTSANNLVGEVEYVAAPYDDRELGRSLGGRYHQPLITELFCKQVHPQLAGSRGGDDQGEVVLRSQHTTFDDDGLCPGGGDDVVAISGDDQQHTTTPDNIGMNVLSCSNVCEMKDEVDVTVPSSGEGGNEDCTFKRGVCLLHKVKGEKYVQSTKNWKDRGGGRGYAFVTSKRVRYRCMVARKLLPRSSSLASEVGGSETCGE